MHDKRTHQRGFTLMEIMVVIFIMGLLIAVVAPSVLGSQDKAMKQKVMADLSTLEQALDMYRLDNLRFPSSEQGLAALVSKPAAEPLPRAWRDDGYIRRLPEDPWGTPYQYRSPGEHGRFDVFSLGADGLEGGEGMDADLGNWEL